jgi:hypothetical protein
VNGYQQLELPGSGSTATFTTVLVEVLPHPRARHTDPSSSHEAATRIRTGNGALIAAIRDTLAAAGRPLTQYEIAEQVGRAWPGRWQADSIRTACARARLELVDRVQVEGRWYSRYRLNPTQETTP